VCTSSEKGTIKVAAEGITLREDWGIEGDAHAGRWHRQVSLLSGESIDSVRDKLPDLASGMFAENIVTRGFDLALLVAGDRIGIGPHAILEVTQVGKECHNDGCSIRQATGDCIMPREGVFCKVLQGGDVMPGSEIRIIGHTYAETPDEDSGAM
jgi:MOSC domain-containing protein YiiM